MAPTTTARVPGHTLRYEGRTPRGDNVSVWLTSGPGMARCSCGDLSPYLPTTAARKRWHREHKAAVIEAGYAVQRDAS